VPEPRQIDGNQQVAFFVRLPDDVSRHLGLNLRVYVAIKRCHPTRSRSGRLSEERWQLQPRG
jgi:hypothetical protein